MNKSSISLIGSLIALMLLLQASYARALICDEIMDKVRENRFPETSLSNVKMTLIDHNGGKRERKFIMRMKNIGDDTKTLIYFEAPPDVRGTSYLIIQTTGKDDKSFIYFPSFGKIKKISSGENSQRFMGSDYTYGDFKIGKKDEFYCKLLGDEKDTWKIESTPANNKDAQYGKV